MLTSLSIVLAVALGLGSGDRAKPVEHSRAASGGYALTVHPGFVSRAYIEEPSGEVIELYRQSGSFDAREGVATKHQIRFNGAHRVRIAGGPTQRDITVGIADGEHQIARISIDLYGESHETIDIDDDVITCPPICGK